MSEAGTASRRLVALRLAIAGIAAALSPCAGALGIEVSPQTLTVPEGGSAAYTVRLLSAPAGSITIAASSSVDTVAVAPAALTFSSDDWETAQTLAVAAQDDDIDAPANVSASISHAVSGHATATAPSVAVTVADDDRAGISYHNPHLGHDQVWNDYTFWVMPGLDVIETLSLNSQPTGNVTIALTMSGGSSTSSPAALVFTPDNWDAEQRFTIETPLDATVGSLPRHTVSSSDANYDGRTLASRDSVAFFVPSADGELRVQTTNTVFRIPEGGRTDGTRYRHLQLYFTGRPPPAGEDVVMSVDWKPGSDPDLYATAPALTFTTQNWVANQILPLAAAEDDDAVDGAGVMVLTASSSDPVWAAMRLEYPAVELDNDVPGDALLTAWAVSSRRIRLTLRNINEFQNHYFRHSADATGCHLLSSREFTGSGARSQDVNAAPATTYSFFAYSDAACTNAVAQTTATTPGIALSTSSLAVAEGEAARYAVSLATEPQGSVTVAASSTRPGAVAASAPLTFTSSDYDIPQTVTVHALDNDAANARASVLIRHAAGGGYDGGDPTLRVTVIDDETAGVEVSATALAVPEHGSASYALRLDSRPGADVRIAARLDGDDDLTHQPQTLTFSPADYAQPQTVTVSAAGDADDAGGTATISHAASSTDAAYSGIAIASVALTEADDERPPLQLLVAPARLGEDGGEARVTARLAVTTTAPVVLQVSAAARAPATAADFALGANAALTIAAGATESVGTVAIVPRDDFIDGPDKIVSVTATASTTDARGVAAPPAATLTIVDDDTLGIVLSPAAPSVAENGGTANYAVSLGSLPNGPVTVTPQAADAATASGPLTFDASTWRIAQTATVTGVDDAVDNPDDRRIAAIRHDAGGAAGSAYDGISATLQVVVRDDGDDAGIVLDRAALAVPEGASSSYAVALSSQPESDVRVGIARTGGDPDLAPESSVLVFTPGNWSVMQTVAVSAAADADNLPGSAEIGHRAHSLDRVYAAAAAVALTATERDARQPAVRLLLDPASIVEAGGVAAVRAAMVSATASAPVVATVSAAAVAPATAADFLLGANRALTIAAGATESVGTVTITAVDNSITAADKSIVVSATVQTAAPEGVAAPADATLVVIDDDTPGIALSATSTALAEGGEFAYAVRLRTVPAGPVTVAATSSAAATATAAPAQFVFTVDDWSTARSITVLAADDDVDNADDARQATIRHAASGGGYDGLSAALSVQVSDDDVAGIAAPDSLAVPEGGALPFAVSLATRPTGMVTVSLSRSAGDADISVSTSSLAFAPATWSTAQTATLHAADDGDDADGQATITLLAASADAQYDGASATLLARELDDDALRATLRLSQARIAEDGGRALVSVALRPTPSRGAVVVAVSAQPVAPATAANFRFGENTLLTVAAGATSSVGTVSVTAVDDFADTGDLTIRISGVATTTSGHRVVPPPALELAIADDDSAALTLSATGVAVAEAGGTAAYTLHLATRPAAPVTVSASSSAPGIAVVAPALLTFSTSDWSTARPLTATGIDDDIDNPADVRIASIVHAATGGGYDGLRATLAATAADDDSAALVLSATGATLSEAGGTAAYSLRLATRPAAPVTVSASSDAPATAAVAPALLTFSASDWSTAQPLTLTGIDDDVDNPADARRASIVHAATGGGYDGLTATLAATVADDDTAALVLSAAGATVAEAGGTFAYSLHLATRPAAPVTVSASSSAPATATVAPALLTFSTSDWSAARPLTLTGVDDDLDNPANARMASIVHAASGGGYDDLTATLAATVADDDGPALVLSAASATVAEAGGTFAYALHLATRPAAPVTVSASSSAPAAAAVAPALLTFSTSDWSTARAITLEGIDDDVDNAGNARTAAIAHRGSGGGYDGLTAMLRATVADDDAAGLLLSTTTLSVPAQGEAHYRLRLATRPLASVEIVASASSTEPRIGLRGSGRLTFEPSAWNLEQRLTLFGIAGGADFSWLRVRHAASSADANYRNATATLRAAPAPSFGGAQVADQRYRVGERVELQLPLARGVQLSHALSAQPPLPNGLRLDAGAGLLTGTPTAARALAEHVWTATDALGAMATLRLRIGVSQASGGGGGGSAALHFAAQAEALQFVSGKPIEPLVLPAAVGGAAPVSYAMPALPAGLAFDPATRTLSGTPTAVSAPALYSYQARDANDVRALLEISIEVRENLLPSFGDAQLAPVAIRAGAPARIALPAAAGGNGELRYALSPALPAGMAFDAAARTVSGTPAAASAAAQYAYSATDEDGDAATLPFMLEVLPADGGDEDARPASFMRGWRIALPALLRDPAENSPE